VGKVVEDVPVTNLAKFGAFVDLGDGIEGMIHIADITSEKRLDHPKDMLAAGQKVRALILEVDRERRRIRLGMKQLEPTVVDKFIEEHKVGDTLSGRVISVAGEMAKVEVSEGIAATCRLPKDEPKQPAAEAPKAADLSSMTAMLAQRWKQGGAGESAGAPKLRTGEIRSFRISKLDAAAKRIEVEMQ
jgi:small subunit ribosomal protein S1